MSVWGTGGDAPRAEAFLDGLDHRISRQKGAHHHTSPYASHGFAYGTGCVLDHGKPPPRPAPIPCHPCALAYRDYAPNSHAPRTPKGTTPRDRRLVLIRSALTVRRRYGNIHPFIHSTTPVGLALGPDSPGDDERGPGTLGHPADGILTRLSLLMSAFSLVGAPPSLPVRLRGAHDALLPLPGDESPRNPQLRYTIYCRSFSAQHRSMSQLLRTV